MRLNPKTLQYSLNVFAIRPCSIWTSIYKEVTKSEITKDYIMLSGSEIHFSSVVSVKTWTETSHLNVESPLTVELKS